MMRITPRGQLVITLVLLLAGAAWIWSSRDETGGSTAGRIPAPRPGFAAPDFELEGADGERYRLSDLRGRAVLVNVWASWCIPCLAEMPAMQRLYQDLAGSDFELLAVNSTSQDSTEDALAFAREQGLTYPVLFDDQGVVAGLYQVTSLPSSYFVAPDGVIQEVVIGGPMSEALLRLRVEELLPDDPPEKP